MNAQILSCFRYSAGSDARKRYHALRQLASTSRPYHTMDTLSTATAALVVAAANLVLATEATTNQVTDLRVLLIPFMGAIIVSFGAIMLNPEVETRNIVIGRAFIAGIFGTAGPSAFEVFFESTGWMWRSPSVLLLAGGCIAGFVYVLSRPFFTQLYRRSDAIAKKEVDRLERRLGRDTEKLQ